jgi:phage tail sheath protein FI
MPYQLSPGIVATEKDLTTVVPAVATSAGGFAGDFQWGPVDVPTLVTSEVDLVNQFGKPDANTYLSFFTAANFLGYANRMYVVRTAGNSVLNSTLSANIGGNAAIVATVGEKILNDDTYLGLTANANVFLAAKHPGVLGDSLAVALVDNNTWPGASTTIKSLFDVQPNVSTFVSTYGNAAAKDELHLAVIDQDGLITGTKNTVLEKFQYLSKASDAVGADGRSIYYKTVINEQSNYLRWRSHPLSASGAALNWGTAITGVSGNVNVLFDGLGTGQSNNSPVVTGFLSLSNGATDSPTAGQKATGFSLLENDEVYDISLVPLGDLPGANALTVVNTLTGDGKRNDVVIFVSPEYADVQTNLADSTKTTNVTGFRNTDLTNLSSSYVVMDSGWKYQYDRYNDVYRWIPLNADIAGLCARTDFTADPWFSPAGVNRGQIRNVVKLAFNPNKGQRDTLYSAGVNPVISSPGYGTILFGDKTLQIKPSAFDRINVRRLFIVLKKAITAAARAQLFEFNDAFTRAQFRNIVEPYLRDVKGRRGITDFKVVCDDTNNTGEVIDRNEFVADIYVKPARSINYITLNFIATKTGIDFAEVTA